MNENKHFQVEILDTEKFVKYNEVRAVTNPIFFVRTGVPTPDGLLSNEIFGITMEERANIFGYIDLTRTFLHPLVYKVWTRMDNRVREIAHGTKKYKIGADGDFIEDENGETGIDFIKKNMDKIKIRKTDSEERNLIIKFIMENKDKIFINKYIVIPAYYRDVNTGQSSVGVGEINKMYSNLIVSCRALRETADFGLALSHSASGRVQETILNIYNWFTQEPNLAKKKGIMKRAVMGKTADYASRLVLSAPNLKVEYVDDLMVDLDHAAVPLASLCTNLFPFIIYWIRRWFENHFAGSAKYPVITKKGELVFATVKDPLNQFSDDRIKHEIDRFMKGFSNRFIPVTVETEEFKSVSMHFKGWNQLTTADITNNSYNQTPIFNRKLTWCDLIYMAAVESAKGKHIILTRYPMDSFYGQFPVKIVVASTKETEPMYTDNEFYPYYPKIRNEDIGTNTSNKFIDTLQMCNLFLKAIGGDYDGDQVTSKASFSTEANEELDRYINSNIFYIDLSGTNVRQCSNESIQSMYSMTKILNEDRNKITKEVSIVPRKK